MKLSEMRDDQALDALETLIDPVLDICCPEHIKMIREKRFRDLFKSILHNNRPALITILATVECKKPEEFHFTLGELWDKFTALVNDSEVMRLFRSQLQGALESSGAASANTETQE